MPPFPFFLVGAWGERYAESLYSFEGRLPWRYGSVSAFSRSFS